MKTTATHLDGRCDTIVKSAVITGVRDHFPAEEPQMSSRRNTRNGARPTRPHHHHHMNYPHHTRPSSCTWISVTLALVLVCMSSLPLGEGAKSSYWRSLGSSSSSSSSRSRWNRQVSCPKECECRDRSRKVDCTYRALNYIPRGIIKGVKRL